MKRKMAFPIATLALIALNVIIFVLLRVTDSLEWATYEYGLRPAAILQGEHLEALFTSMFLHGDESHLIFNMIPLLIFGIILERRLGTPRFLVIYLVSGFATSIFDLAIRPSSWIVAYGASAAIMGVMGACMVGYPTARGPLAYLIWLAWPLLSYFLPWPIGFLAFFMVLIPAIVLTLTMFVPIWPFLLASITYQIIGGVGVATAGITGGVHYWAHISGIVAGMLLLLLLKPREPSEEIKSREEIPAIR